MLNSDLDTTVVFSASSSFDESSSSSFGDSTTVYFGPTLPNMWYNVPDGLERNPDIIRAEASVLVTPISQAYATEAYYAVKNVQETCAADYKTFCGAPTIDLAAVNTFLDNFMSARHLTESTQESDGVKMVNHLRSYYRKLDSKKTPAPRGGTRTIKSGTHVFKPTTVKSGAHLKPATTYLRKGGRGLFASPQSLNIPEPMEDPRGPPPPHGPPPKNGPPEGKEPSGPSDGPRGPPPRGPPRGPPPPKRDDPEDGSSGDASFDKEGPPPRGPPPRGPPPRGPPPPKREDPVDGSSSDASSGDIGFEGPPPRGPPPRGPPPRGPPPPRSDPAINTPPGERGQGVGPSMNGWWGPPPPLPMDDSPLCNDDDDSNTPCRQEPPEGPPPSPIEDVFYNGALGFGANGDLCMYENFNQLSQPCVDSVAELYDVRGRYWHDSEEERHGHFFFWLFIGFVVMFLIKRCVTRSRRQKMRSFMQAIHSNPALKATIEAETGMPVPEMRCKHLRGAARPEGEKKCCLKTFCKVLCTFVLVFVLSLFMAITSLEITINILTNLDADAQANGTEGPSPLTAMFILLLVNLSELAIFMLAVKAGKCLCAYVCGVPVSNECEPSAPPASPKAAHTVTAAVVQTNPSQPLWSRRLVNPFARMFTSGRVHNDYTALSGEDETEMVTVTAAAPAPQYSLTPVVLSNGQTVLTMSAAPVTRVNLV